MPREDLYVSMTDYSNVGAVVSSCRNPPGTPSLVTNVTLCECKKKNNMD